MRYRIYRKLVGIYALLLQQTQICTNNALNNIRLFMLILRDLYRTRVLPLPVDFKYSSCRS